MLDLFSEELLRMILAFGVSSIVSVYSIPRIIHLSLNMNLTDKPAARKIHKGFVPTLGGIGIFGGFWIGFLLTVNGSMQYVPYIMVASLILVFTGIRDDLMNINPYKKLFIEIVSTLIIASFTDLRITNFHGFMGIEEISAGLSYLTTVFLVVAVINSFNLIDGIDGLAATIGIIASIILGGWFWYVGDTWFAIMSAALAGSLVTFLGFNISKGKNKIFMGDTGSLLVGFILSVIVIRFNEQNIVLSTPVKLISSPAISIAVLIVPLFDTARVFTTRILLGQNPFKADNRHIHHLLLKAGLSHLKATFYLSLFQIFIIIMVFFLDFLGIFWLLMLMFMLCAIVTLMILYLPVTSLIEKSHLNVLAGETSQKTA
jgi:UDP-GlcNAc:undecaprenyl-phosphate/decaprenyl-phosphate GlcNAc-1-phosphate transferase